MVMTLIKMMVMMILMMVVTLMITDCMTKLIQFWQSYHTVHPCTLLFIIPTLLLLHSEIVFFCLYFFLPRTFFFFLRGISDLPLNVLETLIQIFSFLFLGAVLLQFLSLTASSGEK